MPVPPRSRFDRDYPRTRSEFSSWFTCDDDCAEYLERRRWLDGVFICPSCERAGVPHRLRRRRLRCRLCRAETSVISGTLLADTKLSLLTWLEIVWLISSSNQGKSALEVARTLGISYESAWAALHKLRRAMIGSGLLRLANDVEIDEAFIGGRADTAGGGRPRRGAIVLIAVEMREARKAAERFAPGDVRIRRVPDVEMNTITDFAVDSCFRESVIHTDGWAGYHGLVRIGFGHTATPISTSGNPAHIAMPRVRIVAGLLDGWLMKTLHGGVAAHHLDAYVDEFVYWFNRRRIGSRGRVFHELVWLAMITSPEPTAISIIRLRQPHRARASRDAPKRRL
jgi:ISXO2-like transposase domain/Transposase zinc-ribbon domain